MIFDDFYVGKHPFYWWSLLQIVSVGGRLSLIKQIISKFNLFSPEFVIAPFHKYFRVHRLSAHADVDRTSLVCFGASDLFLDA